MVATVTRGPGHGKDARVYLTGFDLSGDHREITVAAQARLHDRTGMGGSAWRKFLAGLKGHSAQLTSIYRSDPTGATKLGEEQLRQKVATKLNLLTLVLLDDAIGRRGVAFLRSSFPESGEVASPLEDLVTLAMALTGEDEVEWGTVIHAKSAITTFPHVGGSVDDGASSANGAVGYLHVFALAADITVTGKIRHSADDSTFADLITFTAVATAGAPTSERVAATGTVNRYINFEATKTGTGASATVAAGYVRN